MKLHRPDWIRAGLWLLGAAVLATTFWAYTRPDFLVALANELWACF
jgi:hypothetical protein